MGGIDWRGRDAMRAVDEIEGAIENIDECKQRLSFGHFERLLAASAKIRAIALGGMTRRDADE